MRGQHADSGTAGQALQQRARRWRALGLALGGVLAAILAFAMLLPVPPRAPQAPGLDKLVNFLAFAALIFPVILTDSRRWYWAVPLAIAYGGAIELIQPSVGRGAEWLDWGADITGVLAGAALAELLHDRMMRRVLGDLDAEVARHEAAEEAMRIEALRAEMMADLRIVLREELAAIARPEALPTTEAADRPPTPPARH